MLSSSILSHRGFFSHSCEQNTLLAFKRAIDFGFGIETDLREHNGQLIICHDLLPINCSPILFSSLIKLLKFSSHPFKIALNIKSDGLLDLIKSELLGSGLNNLDFFVFDMSIPETIKYMNSSIPFYSRISEYELHPQFLSKARGLWIDNFTGSFSQTLYALKYLDLGFFTTIVSSELHLRDHLILWSQLKQSGLYLHPCFQLCTDYPIHAANFFGICYDN